MLFGKGLNMMFKPTKCSLQSSVDVWCFYKLSGVYAFVPQHQNTSTHVRRAEQGHDKA